MILKLPTVKMEEGKKFRRPSVQPGERVSILLELVDALRMNGELVRKAVLPSLGTGAGWRSRVAWGPSLLILADVDLCSYLSLYSFGSISLFCLKGFNGFHCPQNLTGN